MQPSVVPSPHQRRRPSIQTLVLLCATAFAVLASLTIALSTAPLAIMDETTHFDYAYGLWHGMLPSFDRGITVPIPFGAAPPVQWASQHPPLFYVLLAPVVGPLVDGDMAYIAVLAARAVNSVLAGVTVLATWWAARKLLPGVPNAASIAAIVTAMAGMLYEVGGAVYSDLPYVIFTALAVGLIADVSRRGATPRLLTFMALVGAGGMLSRAAYAIVLATMLLAIFLAPSALHGTRRVLTALLRCFAVGMTAVVLAGWYFVRNLLLYGNLAGANSEWSIEHLGRETASFLEVVTDGARWAQLFALYAGDLPLSDGRVFTLLAPAMIGLVTATVAVLRRNRSAELRIGLCVATLIALTLLAIVYFAMGGGGANTRYTLPILPLLATATGLLFFRLGRLGAILTLAWTVTAAWVFLATSAAPVYLIDLEPAVAALRWCTLAVAAACAVFLAILQGAAREKPEGASPRATTQPQVLGQ